MTIRVSAVLLGVVLLLAGPVLAKPAHHIGHHGRHGANIRHGQSHYDYRSAAPVREAFRNDAPDWHRHRWSDWRSYDRGARGGTVVENLRSDFTGGVGYGTTGDVPAFVDGYGQTLYYVGRFRGFAPRDANRIMGQRPQPYGRGFSSGY